MRIVSRRDVLFALITGLTTGVSAWLILDYVGKSLPVIATWQLVIIVPVCWVAGVQFGYFLGGFFKPMNQFGRFAAIGFANALVDFGILYLLIALTGKSDGVHYSLFKAVSFSLSAVHSYLWNKYWAFDAAGSRGGSGEIGRFVGVVAVSALINVSAASAVVAVHLGGFDAKSLAGVGAIVGSAVALLFSFWAFRVFVFRKK